MFDAISTLRAAVGRGVVERMSFRPEFEEWKPPGMPLKIIKAANLIPWTPPIEVQKPQAQWSDPARSTHAQVYRDDGFARNFLPAGATDGTVYEIARFQTNKDQVGIVKYIGTWVEIDDGQGSPVTLDFSNPFTMQDNGVEARFLLRLEQGDRPYIGNNPYDVAWPIARGYGYPEMPQWNDYRFYWGRYANHTWILVPRHHFLRMYIHVISGGNLLRRALGRLQGYNQAATILESSYNVAHGW